MSEPVMKTESFANSTEGFIGCEGQIRAKRAGNLLAGGGAKLAVDSSAESVETDFLTDGEAGEPAGVGRATIGGSPTVLTWYLGEPKTIKEVGLYTFNGDSRANQDYEVRFFNHASQPGVRPKFRDTPDLSTGPKVIGADGGGYHSSFIDSTGGPLTAEKVDWVEVRIWGCHGIRAGEPAKQATMGGGRWSRPADRDVDIESLLAGSDPVRELRERVHESLNSDVFKNMRGVQVAVRIHNQDGETIHALDPITVAVSRAGKLERLSLRFTVDLENKQ